MLIEVKLAAGTVAKVLPVVLQTYEVATMRTTLQSVGVAVAAGALCYLSRLSKLAVGNDGDDEL